MTQPYKTIQFNGERKHTEANTLEAVLSEQNFDDASFVATAVNGDFVPKTARANHPINDGDQIEVVAPMQGG